MTQLFAAVLFLAQLGGSANGTPLPDAVALQRMATAALSRVEKMRNQKLTKPLKMGVKSREEVIILCVNGIGFI